MLLTVPPGLASLGSLYRGRGKLGCRCFYILLRLFL